MLRKKSGLLSRSPGFGILCVTLWLALAAPVQISAQETQVLKTPSAFTETDPTSWRDMLSVESTRWRLTEEEYARYLELMKGPRGSFSVPTITPIEVLGIHAETSAERERYATLWVEMIKADTARVLAFQNTVHAVWSKKYPEEPLINRARINSLRAASHSKFGPLKLDHEPALMSMTGRTLFFTRPDCPRCDDELDTALRLVDDGTIAGLDIYLTGVPQGEDEFIQKWARQRRLPIERLADRSITLNYDIGVSATVARQIGRMPAVPMAVQRRGEAYEWVALGRL